MNTARTVADNDHRLGLGATLRLGDVGRQPANGVLPALGRARVDGAADAALADADAGGHYGFLVEDCGLKCLVSGFLLTGRDLPNAYAVQSCTKRCLDGQVQTLRTF